MCITEGWAFWGADCKRRGNNARERAHKVGGSAHRMMAPRERGAIRPRDLRVTKRESTSRSGTSPPRSVHQWTARAWVPVCLAGPSDSRPSTYLLSTPIQQQRKVLTFRQTGGPTARSLPSISDSGEATGEDRVRDTAAFLRPGHDGLGTVCD